MKKRVEQSELEHDHDKLLQSALARPGVQEFMKVFGEWHELDRRMDVYRSATKRTYRIVTTNKSNAF